MNWAEFSKRLRWLIDWNRDRAAVRWRYPDARIGCYLVFKKPQFCVTTAEGGRGNTRRCISAGLAMNGLYGTKRMAWREAHSFVRNEQ